MSIIEGVLTFAFLGARGSSQQARRIEISTGAATTGGLKYRTIRRKRGLLEQQRGVVRHFLVYLRIVASLALYSSALGSYWYSQGNSFDYSEGKEGHSLFSSYADSHSLAPTGEEGFSSLDFPLEIFSDSIIDHPSHSTDDLTLFSTSLFDSTLGQSCISSFVLFAIAGRPRRRGINGPATPPPAFTVPPYSLSTACANEIQKWCLFRTPYTQEAIDCFESHKTELSATCSKWHNARISCQSQIEERVRLALMPPGPSPLTEQPRRGDEGEGGKSENENDVDALDVKGLVVQREREREPPQRRAERLDADDDRRVAAHAEYEKGDRNHDAARPANDGANEGNDYFEVETLPKIKRENETRRKEEAIIDAQRLGRGAALSSSDERHCGSICQTYCGASKSLLLCMRVLGKSIQQVTDPSCHDTDFARSIVRSLNKKG